MLPQRAPGMEAVGPMAWARGRRAGGAGGIPCPRTRARRRYVNVGGLLSLLSHLAAGLGKGRDISWDIAVSGWDIRGHQRR